MSADIIEHPSGRRRTDEFTNAERTPARFWMKFNIPAFLARTAAMDTTATGALVLLEGYYFLQGKLPQTDEECARVCKLSGKKFARYRAQLFSAFDAEGRNADLDASIEEIKRISSSRREAGRKGGASKSEANAKQMPQQTPPKIELQLQQEKDEHLKSSFTEPSPPPSLPRAREGDDIAAEVLASLPTSARAHPGWRGLGAWLAQLIADGAARADIVVGIAQCLRSLNDQPPNTFGYFSAAIERAREARNRPLQQPGHRGLPDQPHLLGAAGDQLKKRLGNAVFAAWFGQAKVVSVCGDTLTLSVDTRFKRSRILAEHDAACVDAFKALDPMIARLVVTVAEGA